MGKEDFLQLLVAQLQNQDPLNPQDPTEFTAQLAQYSSLEQLFTVNQNLEQMASGSAEMERVAALSMIGREVVTESSTFSLDGKPVELGYRLGQAAADVRLQVLNSNGQMVADLSAEELSAGSHFLSWDGKGSDGQPLPAGQYSLTIKASDSQQQALSARSLVKGTVDGVEMGSSGSVLTTNAGSFALAKVISVKDL
ncbi:basal-body rod modification protein FlgD [Desulfuromonas versatilis]|uniref:Basal-body rod modification protein FlgD n=2 Tax=Desulfuromonas versatilis TaxID=2802975 RepID=A0ABM8HZV1_9BACT|nr:basal-body rod modification protein FlgD [Desulfuromonas versatilis]